MVPVVASHNVGVEPLQRMRARFRKPAASDGHAPRDLSRLVVLALFARQSNANAPPATGRENTCPSVSIASNVPSLRVASATTEVFATFTGASACR